MPMIDAGFLQAYQDILDRRNRGIAQAAGGFLQGATDAGTAAIGRKHDANALAADLEAQRKALAGETDAIDKQRAAMYPAYEAGQKPTYGPYEAAQREAQLADLGTRQSDVSNALGELDKIGPVGFRNVYDVRAPKLPERKATDYSGKWKDVAAGQDADIKAGELARKQAADAERAAKDARDFAQRERAMTGKPQAQLSASVALDQAKREMDKAETQQKAVVAASTMNDTLSQMEQLIAKYGANADTLFGADTTKGKIRNTLGAETGTQEQADRELLANLEASLIEAAVIARKGTGTISDMDLVVIQRGGVGPKATSAKSALQIIKRLRDKANKSAGISGRGNPSDFE